MTKRLVIWMASALVCSAATVMASDPVSALSTGSTSTTTATTETGDPLELARRLIERESYALAIGQLDESLAADPDNADAHNLLGYSYRKLGDVAKARVHYDKALALDPAHKGALEYLGELYVETNEPEKAAALLARLDVLCPSGCEERDELAEALAAH